MSYWTFREWKQHTIDKIVEVGLLAPDEHRADYFRVQINLAIEQALRHGRSGRADDEPVSP